MQDRVAGSSWAHLGISFLLLISAMTVLNTRYSAGTFLVSETALLHAGAGRGRCKPGPAPGRRHAAEVGRIDKELHVAERFMGPVLAREA